MDERIFWINVNQDGLYEYGTPVTLEQLHQDLEDHFGYHAVDPDNEFSALEPNKIEDLFTGDTTKWVEGYVGDDVLSVKEVASLDELKALMTWQDYDPWEDSCASQMDIEFTYPAFVHEDLRRYDYLATMTGYTSSSLPRYGTYNETLDIYMEKLGLSDDDISYHYSEKEQAIFEIAQILQAPYDENDEDDDYDEDDTYDEGEDRDEGDYYDEDDDCSRCDKHSVLTIERYNEILLSHGLDSYVIEDDFAASVASISSPDNDLVQ